MSALLIPSAACMMAVAFLRRRGNGLRESVLKAVLVVLLLIVVSTEILSALGAIALLPLLLFWIGVNVLALVAMLRQLRCGNGVRRVVRKLTFARRGPAPSARAVVFAAFTALVILLTAFVVAWHYPYDADSNSYHMSRVANWINQGNVSFFPTVNQRQNFYAPGSAFAMLHIQLLSATDKYAVMPQYVSMLLCFMLVAMLAGRMRLGRVGEWLAVALTATIPILIGQSHCNQNELVVSALLLAFAWLLIRFTDRPTWPRAAWCGCALGLALVTKGTTFFYGAAIGLPLGLRALVLHIRQRRPWRRTIVQSGAAALLALVFLGPVVARCAQGGKTYLANEFTTELRTTRVGWDILKANALRNAAVHLGMPGAAWNARIAKGVRDGIGDQAGNMESTFRERPFKMHPQISCFYSTNPFHLALALLAWFFAPFVRRVPRGLLAAHLGVSLLAALFFNICLKWQYWGIRLQLPWLLLTMPLVAAVLCRAPLPRTVRQALQLVVAFVVFIGAMPALLMDSDLPLWQGRRSPLMVRDAESVRNGSTSARFSGRSDFSRVAAYLRPFDPDEVGLHVPRGNGCWDYNWWVVFGVHATPGRPQLRHVAPDTWPAQEATPEWVISRGGHPQNSTIMGHRYRMVHKAGGCRIYRRVPDTTAP